MNDCVTEDGHRLSSLFADDLIPSSMDVPGIQVAVVGSGEGRSTLAGWASRSDHPPRPSPVRPRLPSASDPPSCRAHPRASARATPRAQRRYRPDRHIVNVKHQTEVATACRAPSWSRQGRRPLRGSLGRGAGSGTCPTGCSWISQASWATTSSTVPSKRRLTQAPKAPPRGGFTSRSWSHHAPGRNGRAIPGRGNAHNDGRDQGPAPHLDDHAGTARRLPGPSQPPHPSPLGRTKEIHDRQGHARGHRRPRPQPLPFRTWAEEAVDSNRDPR